MEAVVETYNEYKIASPHVVVSKCLEDVKCQLRYRLEHDQYDPGNKISGNIGISPISPIFRLLFFWAKKDQNSAARAF